MRTALPLVAVVVVVVVVVVGGGVGVGVVFVGDVVLVVYLREYHCLSSL
jgi:hypothetical protein